MSQTFLVRKADPAAAIGLYRSLGFRERPPYTLNPHEGALYFEIDLVGE